MSKVQAPVHPLDPLTPPEIERAVAIIRADRAMPDSTRFVSMSVAEPPRRAAPRRCSTTRRPRRRPSSAWTSTPGRSPTVAS